MAELLVIDVEIDLRPRVVMAREGVVQEEMMEATPRAEETTTKVEEEVAMAEELTSMERDQEKMIEEVREAAEPEEVAEEVVQDRAAKEEATSLLRLPSELILYHSLFQSAKLLSELSS